MSSSIRDVDVEHYGAFTTALASLLRTSIAEQTYAEIIDGIPTADTWYAYDGLRHDIIEAHHELCPGILEAAREFRANLRPENLSFDSTVRISKYYLRRLALANSHVTKDTRSLWAITSWITILQAALDRTARHIMP